MVLRLGSDGCLLAPAGGPVEAIESFPVAVLDSTGAGDAHVGTFVAGLGQDLSAKGAVLRANAAGAIVVGRFGGATAPSEREIDEFLATHGIQAEPRPAAAPVGAG